MQWAYEMIDWFGASEWDEIMFYSFFKKTNNLNGFVSLNKGFMNHKLNFKEFVII